MKMTPKIKTTIKMKTSSKMRDSKMKTTSKMKATWKMKNLAFLPKFFAPPSRYLKFFDDFSPWQPYDNWCQTGNGIPHDIYNICGIAHACTNRKDDIFMQRRLGQILTCILEWGQRTCKKSRPYPTRAYTTLVVLVLYEDGQADKIQSLWENVCLPTQNV